jgi:hypothetical protein
MPNSSRLMTAELERLHASRNRIVRWKRWGPYLSERQWGTVREDYSRNGDAWNAFTHDQARSRAYRWGEDGLAGIADSKQRLCFALALWNGRDPILKERLFGLTNGEGNHGEDVKEYYYYLDSTPTHSYMRYLYKYPQDAFPYADLVETSRRRGRQDHEYELIDTGIFDRDRYFDVFVEYAKADPEDILIQITVHNRGPEAAALHVLPTLWFRNRWSWDAKLEKPWLRQVAATPNGSIASAFDRKLGERRFHCEGDAALLFTENETNCERIFGTPSASAYVKDGINDYVVAGKLEAVNPDRAGTKMAAHYRLMLEPGAMRAIRLRLSPVPTLGAAAADGDPFGPSFAATMEARRREADAFYRHLIPPGLDAERTGIMRQALAGMLWTKQYYFYDVDKWLEERGWDPLQADPPVAARNDQWHHMYNAHILSMPDKWEYPWYAAWDLAFHVLALSLVDEEFAKKQLGLMLMEHYLHPNGQIPAYEWNFGAVNPPVHAWAAIFTYRMSVARWGKGDIDWLEQIFQKLALNFTWWVNRKDRNGRNVFEGGFLGMDNIGVFDRGAPLPTGGYLEQADGTAWMALYSLNMLEIVTELAMEKPGYADMGLKFTEHFLWIASAMMRPGEQTQMWDEEDGFFYDVLRQPDGQARRLKIRSLVGLLPFCAVGVFEGHIFKQYPKIAQRLDWFLEARPELVSRIHHPTRLGQAGRRLLAILSEEKLRQVLTKMLDEEEFLGAYGIRSLSRCHAE